MTKRKHLNKQLKWLNRRERRRNPVQRELREDGPRESTIQNKRNKLREREADKQITDWYDE